ncbi:thrombospondin type 3 repeat-containing protein, partial [Candidatus Nitrosopumilus sp. bin_6a]
MIFSDVKLFSIDEDNDYVVNNVDNCEKISNSDQSDFDNDSIGDLCDPDDDNDGILDAIDSFDTNFDDWADFDFDGIGSVKDSDDDNDGILDIDDTDPILPSE